MRARSADMIGDGDPLDICVLTEKAILHSDILLTARPIGGFSMADGGEADDKIIAVMRDDAVYGTLTDLKECPMTLLDRLQHYFLTYSRRRAPPSITRWRLRACMAATKPSTSSTPATTTTKRSSPSWNLCGPSMNS